MVTTHPVQAFIDAKGGSTKVAAATGYTPGAVAVWRSRKKLPRTAWPQLINAFSMTVDDLVKLEKTPRKRRTTPQQQQDAA